MASTPARCPDCHFAPCRCEDLTSSSAPAGPRPGNWPIYSDGAGVHPKQIPLAVEDARRHGVRIEFDKKGRAVFESPEQRKKYCRLHGIHDRNGGYGDP